MRIKLSAKIQHVLNSSSHVSRDMLSNWIADAETLEGCLAFEDAAKETERFALEIVKAMSPAQIIEYKARQWRESIQDMAWKTEDGRNGWHLLNIDNLMPVVTQIVMSTRGYMAT